MGKLIIIKNRIYNDYLMPSRLDEYEKIVKEITSCGYKHISVKGYKQLLKENNIIKDKYFINRHDIDTDIKTAKKFFEIEKKYNAKATYYFRLSTLDFDFMKEIEEYGSEASYHFAEIATYAKRYHIKSKEKILKNMDKIKDMFIQNFKMIEKRGRIQLETVCSHGDFVNRALKIVNNELTKDKNLRKDLGIICEAYDEDIMSSIDVYVSDKPYPAFYTPKLVFEYIDKVNIIYMLTHPKNWNINWFCNTKENLKRLYEGLIW